MNIGKQQIFNRVAPVGLQGEEIVNFIQVMRRGREENGAIVQRHAEGLVPATRRVCSASAADTLEVRCLEKGGCEMFDFKLKTFYHLADAK